MFNVNNLLSKPVLDVMRIRPQVLQTVLLTTGPFRYIVYGSLHAGIVMPKETEYPSFGPNVTFSGSVVDLASITVPGCVTRSIDFYALVP